MFSAKTAFPKAAPDPWEVSQPQSLKLNFVTANTAE